MERLILSEQGYREQMENVVKPYLDIRKSVLWPEREEGKKIYCERYLADNPKGVVMISHGFTETAEKYKEVIYYFVKKQYHVYLPEYCGHGRSYRLIPDSSLIYVDDYQRYVNLLHLLKIQRIRLLQILFKCIHFHPLSPFQSKNLFIFQPILSFQKVAPVIPPSHIKHTQLSFF